MTTLPVPFSALAGRMPEDDEALHAYIGGILGFHIPRVAVCPGHDAPFDWVADSFFNRAQRQLVLASRGAGKTRSLSILNLLKSKFYPGTHTGHYAAIEDQADWGFQYLKDMLSADHFQADLDLDWAHRVVWENGSWVRIGTGKSRTGVTAYHPNRLVVDEVDLWEPEAYETAMYMISGTRERRPELLVASTAYTAYGFMGTLQQQAAQRGFKVSRHCLFETLQRCPTCQGKSCPLYEWVHPRTGQKEELCKGRALRSDGFVSLEDAIDEYYRTDSESYLVQKLLESPERRHLIYPPFDPVVHAPGPPPIETKNSPKGIGVDWGYDHPLVFTVFTQLGNGVYWGLEEWGERFVSPNREVEVAQMLNKKYRWRTGVGYDYPTFYCGQDQPQSINAFAEVGLIVVPNSPRFREEGHKFIRRLLDPNKGPLLFLDPEAMPMTVHQLGSIHRDDRGREVLKLNDYADSARHVLATSCEQGGIMAGGGFQV